MSDEIATVGVVGGGFMGTGIAESVARAGMEVVVVEPEAARADAARERIEASLDRAVRRGKLEAAELPDVLERVRTSTALDDAAAADLVVEAVSENETLKREIFANVNEHARGKTILASNTSSIPIAELASATDRPDRVLGLHFFSPVPVMRLVEVVVALDTSDETVARAEAFARALGKTPIRTKDRSGFIVNMLLIPYLIAAVHMYEDGFADRESIDDGMRLGAGHPMGPLTLCDFIGLDVLYAVCNSLYEEFKREEYAPPPLMKRMIASGRLGRKAGRGFYDYDS
jgi:3-hydroxybutyryl-CoA dehydrogenase